MTGVQTCALPISGHGRAGIGDHVFALGIVKVSEFHWGIPPLASLPEFAEFYIRRRIVIVLSGRKKNMRRFSFLLKKDTANGALRLSLGGKLPRPGTDASPYTPAVRLRAGFILLSFPPAAPPPRPRRICGQWCGPPCGFPRYRTRWKNRNPAGTVPPRAPAASAGCGAR